MDEEFSSGSPRFSPKRSRLSRRESSEESKHRLKREITRELIDFDVIKGYGCLRVQQLRTATIIVTAIHGRLTSFYCPHVAIQLCVLPYKTIKP